MAGRFVMRVFAFIGKMLKWSLYVILQLAKLVLELLEVVLFLTCSILKIFLLIFYGCS